VSIPDPVLQELERTMSKIRRLSLNARYPKLRSIHLTLKFLGDLESEKVQEVSRVLDTAVQSMEPFELNIHGMGVFPNLRRPRIIWVGVEAVPALQELQRHVEENLLRLSFESERRPYRPHLTIARLKDTRNLAALKTFLEEEAAGPMAGTFGVREVHLMQSVLRPQGAEYHQLSNHPLGH
jgi:2'-5' RNA ligase